MRVLLLFVGSDSRNEWNILGRVTSFWSILDNSILGQSSGLSHSLGRFTLPTATHVRAQRGQHPVGSSFIKLLSLFPTLMTTRPPKDDGDSERSSSLIRRSWVAVSDLFSPFSSAALASLPNPARPVRYTRADAIPDTEDDDQGHRPAVRDYHAINSIPSQVRVPKKIATPVKVEAKVWFANERSQLIHQVS